MCHPRAECRGRNFGKENRQALLQKSSEIFITECKWTSATACLSESSLSDLGGKTPQTSLTTFQIVVKKPDLANLHLYFWFVCFPLSAWFCPSMEFYFITFAKLLRKFDSLVFSWWIFGSLENGLAKKVGLVHTSCGSAMGLGVSNAWEVFSVPSASSI